MKKTFFVVEDHSLMRQGITGFLAEHSDFECIGYASNSTDFFDAMQALGEKTLPAVLITDLNIEGSVEKGLSLIKNCRSEFPTVRIVVYSMHSAGGIVGAAFEAGCDGFVSKMSDEVELKNALESAVLGKRYVDPQIAPNLVLFEMTLSKFSMRENEILRMILQNKSNVQIAEELGINKRTVENCISRIYNKTGFSTHKELIASFGSGEF
ncbi:response regulator transcription factor [uncultured Treponema sp.]|uniref:response regulator n=1 Tax=uncultured Treponema sp. TaxID=162155 RepID=UPI0025EB4DBB|nr:response regulator transcription factor [uncultured Treponema sp.]